jgi:hypothetical protein
MRERTWYETIGQLFGIWQWCPICYKSKWFHPDTHQKEYLELRHKLDIALYELEKNK